MSCKPSVSFQMLSNWATTLRWQCCCWNVNVIRISEVLYKYRLLSSMTSKQMRQYNIMTFPQFIAMFIDSSFNFHAIFFWAIIPNWRISVTGRSLESFRSDIKRGRCEEFGINGIVYIHTYWYYQVTRVCIEYALNVRWIELSLFLGLSHHFTVTL